MTIGTIKGVMTRSPLESALDVLARGVQGKGTKNGERESEPVSPSSAGEGDEPALKEVDRSGASKPASPQASKPVPVRHQGSLQSALALKLAESGSFLVRFL